MNLPLDLPGFLARCYALAELEDLDRSHVLVAVNPDGTPTPCTAMGPYACALDAMAAATTWAAELNAAGALGPSDPPYIVVAIPLFGPGE